MTRSPTSRFTLSALMSCVLFLLGAGASYAQSINDLAAKGDAVASADPRISRARDQIGDPVYRRGFNIATGLFGDPALGGEGHTLPGPGSAAIRASLTPAGQNGFDAGQVLNMRLGFRPAGISAQRVDSGGTINDRSGAGAAIVANLPQKVPDVVGLTWFDAESVLRKTGFTYKETHEETPNPAVLYGHVRATRPSAGQFAPGGSVELLIPRAASLLGIGALGLDDFNRRDGFDLDLGQYQQVFSGADIVLVKHPAVTHQQNGYTIYDKQAGIYVEPSDGAVLVDIADHDDSRLAELGDFSVQSLCDEATNAQAAARDGVAPRAPAASIQVGYGAAFCVLTSQRQVAVVEFLSTDNGVNVTDFKFHFALFPQVAPVSSIGRGAPGAAGSQPAQSICEAAAEARARNSPAAPGLAQRCRDEGPNGRPPQ